jgi:hypothetical protein
MIGRPCSLIVLAAIACLAPAAAFESGPAGGTTVAELKVYDVTGPHAGAEVDYAADRKTKPTIYVFVLAEKWDRPVARFLRQLDNEVQKRADLRVVAIWLTDEPETTKGYLPLAQQSLQLKATTLTCYPLAKKAPERWDINLEAGVTAVVARDGKVVKSLAFRSATESNVKDVAQALQKLGDGK